MKFERRVVAIQTDDVKTSTAQMLSTRNIQRLKQPRPQRNPAEAAAFESAGVPIEMLRELLSIFSFDRMGPGASESGTVAQIIQLMNRHKQTLSTSEFTLPLHQVAPHWSDRSKRRPGGEATIYVLCPHPFTSEVEARIRRLARDGYQARVVEDPWLAESLRPMYDWDRDVCGWLELNNGFFFFSDRTMWEKTAALFGLKTTA